MSGEEGEHTAQRGRSSQPSEWRANILSWCRGLRSPFHFHGQKGRPCSEDCTPGRAGIYHVVELKLGLRLCSNLRSTTPCNCGESHRLGAWGCVQLRSDFIADFSFLDTVFHSYCFPEAEKSVAGEPSIDGMYHALIRTHHITSRKKVARLKSAAKTLQCFALLRSGGIPGVMYVQGNDRSQVQNWVDTVHDLRYKDYQLMAPVAAISDATLVKQVPTATLGTLEEVDTVKEMGAQMEVRGLQKWWRIAMGFVHE